MKTITERVAVVTGALGGVGQALCRTFAEAGYSVISSDRESVSSTDFSYAHVPIDLHAYCIDGSIREQAHNRFDAALAGRSLVVVIHNAALQIVKPMEALTAEDWQRTLNINVTAPFLLTQRLLPYLETAQGSVLHIGSIHAALTKPEFVAYATSKSALSGLTRSLAVELGRRVRVNAICPAAIATPMLMAGFSGQPVVLEELEMMHPVGHIGQPEDVAALALFLASDSARFINGAEVGLDGGIRARLHDPV